MNRTPTPLRTGHAYAAVSLLAGAALLGACSSSPAPTSAAPPIAASTSTTTSSSPTPSPTTTTAALTTTPAPAAAGNASDGLTPERLHQLLVILEAVNPGVSTDETALVNASLMVCSHIHAHESDAAVDAVATNEFTNGAYTPSPEEAQAMRMAVAKTFCFG